MNELKLFCVAADHCFDVGMSITLRLKL